MQETEEMWGQSLRGEDPLEEGITTHSSILCTQRELDLQLENED